MLVDKIKHDYEVGRHGLAFRKYFSLFNKNRIAIIQKLIPKANREQYALDIGCDVGFFTNILTAKGFRAFGVDLNEEKLKIARKTFEKNAVFVEMSGTNLGFAENAFDLVLALEIIEHLNNPSDLLNEICRVTKKGGKIVISTPNRLSLEGIRGRIFEILGGPKWVAWDPSHKKIFSSTEFISLLERCFVIKKLLAYYNYIPVTDAHFLDFLRYSYFDAFPLNRFGFNIIALCINAKATRPTEFEINSKLVHASRYLQVL